MALVNCKECGEKVSTKAKSCPACGAKSRKKTSIITKFALVSFVLAMGIVIYDDATMTPDKRAVRESARIARAEIKEKEKIDKAAKKAEERCNDRILAFVMGNSYVKKTLKAPSTAKFPYVTDDDVRLTYLGDCTHQINGFVDAENSFGATIRSRYKVIVKNTKGTEYWNLIDLQM